MPSKDTLPDNTVDDQRAPDQDAAVEQAFIDGTLPEMDRRTQPIEEAVGALPPGSRVSWEAGQWTVRRGHSISATGHGPTFARALRMVGASMQPFGADRKLTLVDESGEPIPAE